MCFSLLSSSFCIFSLSLSPLHFDIMRAIVLHMKINNPYARWIRMFRIYEALTRSKRSNERTKRTNQPTNKQTGDQTEMINDAIA